MNEFSEWHLETLEILLIDIIYKNIPSYTKIVKIQNTEKNIFCQLKKNRFKTFINRYK